MCSIYDQVCPEMEEWLESIGFKPKWEPNEYPDIVLKIAKCSSNHSGKVKCVTYYPYRSIGWAGFKEIQIKSILKEHGWRCIERGLDGKTVFYDTGY